MIQKTLPRDKDKLCVPTSRLCCNTLVYCALVPHLFFTVQYDNEHW